MDEPALAALLGEHATRHGVPGAVVGILRDGTTMVATHGVADIATGEAVTPDTRFSAGSLTKPMVATLIAGLAAEGRLSLDDSVSSHLPFLGGGWADQATVRDLLGNRSGLPLRHALEFGFDAHRDSDDGALDRLVAELPADVSAGDVWSYSNVGWSLLGRVIEVVTGGTWEVAMRHALFEPTGMERTTFAFASDPNGRAAGYLVTPDGPSRVESPVGRAYGPAGTSVLTTVHDLLRFATRHLDDPTLAALRGEPSDQPIHGWLDAWCLGWARFDWGGEPVWGWDGLIGGERSVLRLLPERRTAIAVLANGSTGRAMSRSLLGELVPEIEGMAVPPLRLDRPPVDAPDLQRYAGLYAWPDRWVEVTAASDHLEIGRASGEWQARPLGYGIFLIDPADPDNPTVTFGRFDADGRPQVLYLMLWGLPRVGARAAVARRLVP